ncbi:unnamed protein product, partial [marine sediment metagenome]
VAFDEIHAVPMRATARALLRAPDQVIATM